MAAARRFRFAFARAYRVSELVFGVTPSNAWVEVTDTEFEARFGHWRVHTPLTNVIGTEITGPYAFVKTAGPARLAVTDRGLTFATNGDRGVRIDFRTTVRGMDRFGLIQHPELTVTVADIEELATLLNKRIAAQRGA